MPSRIKVGFGSLVLLCLMNQSVSGFSLLGPYTPWMTATLGYHQPSDTGGPMELNAEYRWNLPLITYGFDQEFVDYFGTQGVVAVEQAISMLTSAFPVSGSSPVDYPLEAKRVNVSAQALSLLDLKSVTLGLLLEQVGLAQPSRYAWTLAGRQASPEGTNYVTVMRNYDPLSLQPTNRINGASYTYYVDERGTPPVADAVEFQIDPLEFGYSSVSELNIGAGEIHGSLTADDMGGLRYLFRRVNINIERLPDGVTGLNGAAFVNRAPRPGVETIRFAKLKRNPEGGWRAITQIFSDKFFRNGTLRTQRVQRIIRRPDILFQARTLVLQPITGKSLLLSACGTPVVSRSDTARWRNYSGLNGMSGEGGPGIIPPGAIITFGKLNESSSGGDGPCVRWASYSEAAADVIIYPIQP